FYFERDGQLMALGNTHIAFSPRLVAGNILDFRPRENLSLSLLSKYVGKQYMGNIDSGASVLKGYGQTDFNVQYTLTANTLFKRITFSALVNNIFDAQIISNGYFFTYDDDFTDPGSIVTVEGAGYYPQAGTNFLLGLTL